MIGISVFVIAALFVVFGLQRIGAGHGCGSGHCDSCSDECELDIEGRHP